MHADQRAVLRGLGERLEDGGIVHHQDVGVGHEQLETGHPFPDQFVHVFQAALAQVGHDHVQSVVDAGFAFGLLPPGIERVAHARAARLDGEIDNAGGAAEGRRAGAGFEIVGAGGAAERHVEVGVAVDAAGQHVHARGVDYTCDAVGGNAGADLYDGLAFDQDVGRLRVSRGDYLAVANQGCHSVLNRAAARPTLLVAPRSPAGGRFPYVPW